MGRSDREFFIQRRKEVQQALLSHDEMKLLDETVQAYWDNIKQMKSSIEQLNIQLNQQSIEEQQFEETQQLLHDIKAAVKKPFSSREQLSKR